MFDNVSRRLTSRPSAPRYKPPFGAQAAPFACLPHLLFAIQILASLLGLGLMASSAQLSDSQRYYAELHKNPSGAGDGRPTASQVIEHEKADLASKVVLVTGFTSGIGRATVAALLASGARVFATARDMARANRVKQEILEEQGSSGTADSRLSVVQLELEEQDSVRECAREVLAKTDRLNILVCNAGKPVHCRCEGRASDWQSPIQG